ncbi:MAG: hypothetical protein LBU57_05830, partial [Dysgonamonadaceae bacterium]|nr:hypothetical protein [Dysgonamonadaceae bacterium]
NFPQKGTNSTLKPNEDNNFIIRSSLTRDGRQINVNVPAGAVDKEVSFTPTSIPTAGSQGDIDADAPNGSFALEIIDIESNWTGNFLNGKTATFSFPLRQELINNTVKKGIPLFFGSNSGGSWESYPVTINETTGTGTVSIPHFSRWYLTTNILIDISVSQTPFEILGTSSCGENVTVTFNKTNAPIPDFYRNVFGLTSLPNVSQDDTRTGQNGKYWIIRGRCVQKTVSISGTGVAIPSYTYYRAPVTFSSTTVNCDHSGGGGE